MTRWRAVALTVPPVALALALVALLAGCDGHPAAPAPGPGSATAPDPDPAPGSDRAVVRLATGQWAPYFDDGLPHDGLALRVVARAFELEGYDVDLTFLPWSRALEQAREGHFDGTALWGLNDERRARFHVSQSVFDTRWVFFHRVDRPFDWATLADLKGKRVGATSDYTYGEPFYAAADDGTLDVDWVPRDELNYRKLLAGRIDLFPQDHIVGRYDLERLFGHERSRGITYHPRPLRTTGNHLLISRDLPRAATLIAAFDRGLGRLRASGELAELLSGSWLDVASGD